MTPGQSDPDAFKLPGEASPIFCTIVARNYLSFARVLATSLRTAAPDAAVSVLVLDGLPASSSSAAEPFEIVRPTDLMDRRRFHRMAAIYDVMELATAVKPWLLEYLLDLSPVAIYLDPDIQVFSDLSTIVELARQHSVVVTPHRTAPVPRDGKYPSEADILISGLYNLGFIAVSRSSTPFLRWWQERLATDCIVDPGHGLFVDQRWAELGLSWFPHHVLDDPGCNAAYWNLDYCPIDRKDGRYEVRGHPLRFFHFSGFDPGHTGSLSKHARDNPRVVVEPGTSLDELCAEYASLLRQANYFDASGAPYGYGVSSSGTVLDKRLRRLYRDELTADVDSHLADPFDPLDADRFARWAADRSPNRIRQRMIDVLQALGVAEVAQRFYHRLRPVRGRSRLSI